MEHWDLPHSVGIIVSFIQWKLAMVHGMYFTVYIYESENLN